MWLIEAAEKLVAQHGIDGITAKQIIQAAGVRNESALQYHFGSRSALIDAIFELRMSPINAHRLDMLAELDSRGSPPTIRDIVRVLVLPLAQSLISNRRKSYYCRFLERAQSSPEHVNNLIQRRHYSSVLGCAAHFRYLCANLPHAVTNQRLAIALKTLGQGAADIERGLSDPVQSITREQIEARIGNLTDCIVGIMTAEVVDGKAMTTPKAGKPAAARVAGRVRPPS
jgi:AcrR family transcriptional regulator